MLHARLEPLLLFYIDAASAIEGDDPRWHVHFAVMRSPELGTDTVMGFCTTYDFYAYPDGTRCEPKYRAAWHRAWPLTRYTRLGRFHTQSRPSPGSHRMRLSQIFVLPPYQGMGLGSLLIESANAIAIQTNTLELTYEDPTDDLNRIRDLIDVRRLLATSWFLPAVRAALASDADRKCPAEVLDHAQQELKISRYQMGRVWEQVLLSTREAEEDSALRASLVDVVAKRMKCDPEQRQQQVARGERLLLANFWRPRACRQRPRSRAAAECCRPSSGKRVHPIGGKGGDDEVVDFIMFREKGSTECFVEPDEVVKQRAEDLQEVLQERLDQVAELAPKVQEVLTSALKKARQ